MMTHPGQRAQCRSCTVPIDTGDTCSFCANYAAPETPAQRLDVLVNKIDLIRHDGNEILRELPTDAPLLSVADLVAALGHLRQAAVLVDKATDQIEAAAAEVTR